MRSTHGYQIPCTNWNIIPERRGIGEATLLDIVKHYRVFCVIEWVEAAEHEIQNDAKRPEIHVCMYVFMYVCMHACMCVCACRVRMLILLGMTGYLSFSNGWGEAARLEMQKNDSKHLLCMYVCMYVEMTIATSNLRYTSVCVCVCLYIYVCVCVCMYVCMLRLQWPQPTCDTPVCTHTHTHTHIYTYTNMHTVCVCVCVCVCIQSLTKYRPQIHTLHDLPLRFQVLWNMAYHRPSVCMYVCMYACMISGSPDGL
jgi:hypothetical protein